MSTVQAESPLQYVCMCACGGHTDDDDDTLDSFVEKAAKISIKEMYIPVVLKAFPLSDTRNSV